MRTNALVDVCAIADCNSLAAYHSPERCRRHYNREARAGNRPERTGHGRPRGSRASHAGIVGAHDRVRSEHGPARLWRCAACLERATDWALQPDASEVHTDATSGCLYSLDTEDDRPRCRACQHALDARARAHRAAALADPGHMLPGLGTITSTGPASFRPEPLTRWQAEVAPCHPTPEPLPIPGGWS